MKTILALFVWLLAPALAQAVAPRLSSLSPSGAQRGAEIEVRFNGQRLDDTKEIVLYTSGLSIVKMEPAKADVVKATLKIDANCRLGEHQLRLRTATGVSELRTFFVGALPVVAEVEPNSEVAKAQKISLNSTVSGTVASEDQDYFLVTLEKGQRLTAEVEAMRLGRAAFDAALSIHDAGGKLLASADDSVLALQDPILRFVAPAAGDYLVQVRETSYGGNDNYVYRLHIGDFPRPSAVYPAGGPAGEKLEVKFIGDAAGDFTQQIKLPTAKQERFGVFSQQGDVVAPSPNWLRVSPFPNVLESGANQSRDKATATDQTPPLALNGILGEKGQSDWFRFKAKKDQALEVTVFARRLRSPLDSVVEIFDAKGNSVASNDDTSGPDSSVKFTPDKEGDYFVKIRDHLNGGGRDYVYRIEIAPPAPSLSLKTPDIARYDSQSRQYIAVPRGNRFATLLGVKRANVNGELSFQVEGLPEGAKLIADSMPSAVDSFPVVFEAASDAPVTGKLLDLVATTSGASAHWRNDVELVQGPNNSVYYATRVDKLLVAVTEAAPFKLRIEQPKVPIVQGGSMELKVVAERDPGFEEPITLRMVWNPPGITSQPDITIPKGENSAFYTLNAKGNANLRSWKIAVHGSATVNGGSLWVSSPLTPLEIAEPFLTAKIETSACQPGKSTNIVVKLDQKVPFEGKATIRLIGLPEKAVVPEKEITCKDTEVVFPLKVDPTCSTGSHKNLFCTAAIKKNGEVIPHNLGAGGILRIVPPKKPVAASGEAKKVAKNEK